MAFRISQALLGFCRGVTALALVTLLTPAHAHLMVAQKGTLNFVGDGAYMVLSLPVSALRGVDRDGDGLMSAQELRAQILDIERQVRAGVVLSQDGRALPLEGLMLELSPPDEAPLAPAGQLVALGRFALGPDTVTPQAALTFELTLFGREAAEQAYDIGFTRPASKEANGARFTPQHAQQPVFASNGAVFFSQLRSGAEHVLGGWDHLLFLFVVLSAALGAGFSWRHLLLTLTAFTAGHAITLAASAWGGLKVSPAWVEPAIALTIVLLALVDIAQRRKSRAFSRPVHLALVFGCALIHGLGLAGAMGQMGLGLRHLMVSLAGFNLGIEIAQVGVAAAVLSAFWVLERTGNRAFKANAVRIGPFVAAGLGGLAFVMRAAQG